MKILARTILMLLALVLGMTGDLLDSTSVNAANWGIVAEDSDADMDETKCCSSSLNDVVLLSASHLPGAASIQILPRLLDTSPLARYILLSVYRI